MKAVQKLVLLLTAGLLPAVVASASPLEEAYLQSCRKDPGVPVPVSVVSPLVGPEHTGGSVQLEFVVDAKGKPSQFSIKSATDDALAVLVVRAVKQWRFDPAEVDGRPIAMKVGLPVRIVGPSRAPERVAARE